MTQRRLTALKMLSDNRPASNLNNLTLISKKPDSPIKASQGLRLIGPAPQPDPVAILPSHNGYCGYSG